MSSKIHQSPDLRRAGEIELERHRRSGRSFSLILVRLRRDARSRRRRRVESERLRATAHQHVRPFDAVAVAADVVGVVAHDADAASAQRIVARLSGALSEGGGEVIGVGAATFPEDGLLWTHLADRASTRLDASLAVGATSTGADADVTVPRGSHR